MKQIIPMLCAVLVSHLLSAQLVVTPEPSDSALIFSLAGPGIVVTDPVRTCDSAGLASGYFDATSTGLALAQGIIITSGISNNAIGPNSSGSSGTANGTPGDADLTKLLPGFATTYDACVLEFNMTVASDTLNLDYIFGSEEYLEFVASGFNDVFAFFLSGPGIVDAAGIPDTINIARVPGTGDIVSINSVNDVTNSAYYLYNGDGFTSPYDTSDYYVQYDGLTNGLAAIWPVTPGGTYHMKLAVADALDMILDSGVFLKWGALGSLRLAAETLIDEGPSLIEGCVTGTLRFNIGVVNPDTVFLDYYLAGSADISDLESLPVRIAIPPGEVEVNVPISAVEDGVSEGGETLTLIFVNPQSGYEYYWLDVEFGEVAQPDFTSTDLGGSIQFAATSTAPVVSYFWDFDDGTTSTMADPVHEFSSAGVYNVCLTTKDENGCEATVCKVQDIASGTSNPVAANSMLVPNPSAGLIQIHSALSGPVKILIYNAAGRVVSNRELFFNKLNDPVSVDLSSLPGGIYNITLQGETAVETHTLIRD